MASQEHLDLLKQGVEVWNKWRQEHPEVKPDLRDSDLSNIQLIALITRKFTFGYHPDFFNASIIGADFTGADLSGANLSGANMMGADLKAATLVDVVLVDSILVNADFSGAILKRAKMTKANLNSTAFVGADLSNADLSEASLYKSELTRSNLQDANLNKALLYNVDLSDADLTGANLSEANLTGANLVGTVLTKADLTGCRVYGISVWDIRLAETKQQNLVITPDNQPTITVDNLEVAQFIYLLLNHKKLRDVLNAVTERGVLLLGRFGGGGLDVLQAIAAGLRDEKYLPIIFDFERPQDRNYTETVKTLVGLSRFVIVDLSGPSVPQELYATVPHYKIPFVPIIEASRKPYAMAKDLLEYPWVVKPPIMFATVEELLEQLYIRIIAPAEEMHQARQKLLDELFNDV